MSRRDHLLAIDCGTQSLRAHRFSPQGDLLATARVQYTPYTAARPGWAEQDPEVFWCALCDACRRLKEQDRQGFQHVAGMGVTTQRDSMVNVDAAGSPLRPMITWLDQRKARPVYRHPFPLNLACRVVGMEEAVLKAQMDAKCNWIRQEQPEIWEQTHQYLQLSGFLYFRLTGRFGDSVASQIGHIPFHYKKLRWAAPGELPQKLMQVEPEKLPPLYSPGEILGRVSARAAAKTGLPQGLPVVSCGSDKGCETLGVGAVRPETASLSFGTTATVQSTVDRYCEPLRFMPAYPAPLPGRYNPEVEIYRGFWMVRWFKEEFAHEETRRAEAKGIPAETLMNEMLLAAPPGAMGLTVQPFWGPGLKTPAAKGAVIGFGDVHGKSHFYRAVIEGLGFALLEGLERIERASGTRVRQVGVSGGASQSDEICRIAADIFNRPLFRGRTWENSGLGAAILTAVGVGVHPDVAAAIGAMVHPGQCFEPRPENARLYRRIYRRVYRKIYRALSPLYEEIREITNYPERPPA